MISIIEQERRKAVKDYQSQISMVHADEVDDAYWKGWYDHKKMMPSDFRLYSYFAFGIFIGFISSGIFL